MCERDEMHICLLQYKHAMARSFLDSVRVHGYANEKWKELRIYIF